MSEWYRRLDGLWARGWDLLEAGGAHRFVTLATLGAAGPQARLVVLRGADRGAATLSIFTDATSTKVAELSADPRASLHHWTASEDLQIRVSGTASVTTGAALQADWDALPEPQRQSYGVTPPPGTPIPGPTAYERAPSFDQLAKLTVMAQTIDIVHLSPDTHRRALFRKDRGWQGAWLAP